MALFGCAIVLAEYAYAAMEPDNVIEVVSQAAAECRSMGGRPNTEAMLSVDDLNGDGGEDWIIDFSKLRCAGSPNPFCGSGGCSLQIFLWSQGSVWISVFDGVVQKYRLLRFQQRRAIELTMRGEGCEKSKAGVCHRRFFFGSTALVPIQ